MIDGLIVWPSLMLVSNRGTKILEKSQSQGGSGINFFKMVQTDPLGIVSVTKWQILVTKNFIYTSDRQKVTARQQDAIRFDWRWTLSIMRTLVLISVQRYRAVFK